MACLRWNAEGKSKCIPDNIFAVNVFCKTPRSHNFQHHFQNVVSVDEGTHLNWFRISQITPVYNTGGQSRCTNYRLISILLQFNKIFEQTEDMHIYKSFIYCQNINMNADPDLQLLMWFKLQGSHAVLKVLKKYWISKLVFKTLKKYWIWPKCTSGIEKVWKF